MSEKKLDELKKAGLTPEATAEALMFDTDGGLSPEQIAELDPELAEFAGNILAVQKEIAALEAGMTPEELDLVEQVVTAGDLSEATIKQKTDKAPRKNILTKVLLLIVLLAVLVASCAPAPNTEVPATGIPTVVAAETIDTDPTASIEATSTALDDINVDYGRFTGNEAVVDPYLEKAWELIDENLVKQGIVAPNGIEVIDVSQQNVIVEVISGSGYPEGTMFTISFVQGHSGETLTISLDGANAVCGGTAVELAIGANQLPVALDINGGVVAYVDSVTGQWIAGSAALAGEVVATPQPPEADYFSLSNEQKIELSRQFVEGANGFSGEIGIPVKGSDGKTYYFYWDPTAVDKDETPFVGAWRTENQSTNLDKTGETLPSLVIPGYENADGSLVVVNPITGQQTVYANPNIPAFGGTISYRELFNLPQSSIADTITDISLGADGISGDQNKTRIITELRKQSLYIPVLLYGPQNSVYAEGFVTGGGYQHDLPEAQFTAIQVPTNEALVPIFSPESGNFMFFVNLMSGNALSFIRVEYDESGSVSAKFVYNNKGQDSFGINGEDRFGFIVQSIHPQVAHNLGGGEVFNENSPSIGDINLLEAILNAKSEQEIMDILESVGMIVAYPSVVVVPE